MKNIELPFVKMPQEFVTLLKSNLSSVTSPSTVFDVIRKNKAIYRVLEISLSEFDDGRGVEKLLTALGWTSFRDRMASLYIYKVIYGHFPSRTNLDLVEDIKKLESLYGDHGVHGYSRLFLLGFYLRLSNLQIQKKQSNQLLEIKIPTEVSKVLKLSQVRSEKLDWLILLISYLILNLGEKTLINLLSAGKRLDDIFPLLSLDQRENLHQGLLAYGASINEPDFFLFEKV